LWDMEKISKRSPQGHSECSPRQVAIVDGASKTGAAACQCHHGTG
jgi:hypothetical protein